MCFSRYILYPTYFGEVLGFLCRNYRTMKNNILRDIIRFSKKVKGCKLAQEILEDKAKYMTRVDTYFGTSRFQSIILVAVFELNSSGIKPNNTDLAKHFKCNIMELFVYKESFVELKKKGIFSKNHMFSFLGRRENEVFDISKSIRDSIVANEPYHPAIVKALDPIEICEEVQKLIDNCVEFREDTEGLFDNYNQLLFEYKDTSFIKYINQLVLSDEDTMVYIYVISQNLNGNAACAFSNFSSGIFPNRKERILYEKAFYDKKAPLLKEGFVKLNEETYFSAASISLTQQCVKTLLEFDIPIRLTSNEKEIDLLQPKKIAPIKMFYNKETQEQMDNITQSLRPLKHKQIIKSLRKEGYKTGVCSLLYGAPGTGKTEGVYQLAKITGRAIWKVDISELKSMFFGESQKLIKGLFTDYKALCSREKRVPILLLNEADAILGKRNAVTSSSTDKANNAIQNIFLDCLEDFEGILFATTNLEESLDSAFERRFLFKVRFSKPDKEARSLIWKSKIGGMSRKELDYLAESYDLSGGEIDNITRKFKMERILDANYKTFTGLIKLCETEKLQNKQLSNEIGFKANQI